MSGIRRFRGAIKFRRLSKGNYEMVKVRLSSLRSRAVLTFVKVTSNRVIDDKVAGPLGGRDPPGRTSLLALSINSTHGLFQAGTPPTTPEGLNRTDPPGTVGPNQLLCASTHGIFQAGASATPEESNSCSPHTDSCPTATSSIPVWTQDIEITLSSGAADSGVPMDEVLETYSFIYDPDLATSGTSIASYKTEKSVNSRKSRYNVRPRHKYADHGYSRPQGPGSLGICDASVPKVCKPIDPQDTTATTTSYFRPS
jgi:hypothetical protein